MSINSDDELTFTVHNVRHGQFENDTSKQLNIRNFTQAALKKGEIVFVHDGTATTPSYSVTVTDGLSTSPESDAVILFSNKSSKKEIAAIAGTLSAAALITSLGIIAYRRKVARDKYRERYPLANSIYKKLKLNQFSDFKSQNGRAFVFAINGIDKKLNKNLRFNTAKLSQHPYNEYVDHFIRGARMSVEINRTKFSGGRIDLIQLQSASDRIFESTKSILEKEGWIPKDSAVVDKYVNLESHDEETALSNRNTPPNDESGEELMDLDVSGESQKSNDSDDEQLNESKQPLLR